MIPATSRPIYRVAGAPAPQPFIVREPQPAGFGGGADRAVMDIAGYVVLATPVALGAWAGSKLFKSPVLGGVVGAAAGSVVSGLIMLGGG